MTVISAGSSDASWRRSRSAGRLHWEGTSSSAATAGWFAAPTTPAATDIARSARVWRAPSGSRHVRPSCCRCLTATWSSPYHRWRRRSRSRTSARSTPSCSALRPKRCTTSPPIPSISAQRSARSPCSTLGGKPCSTTRICTALSQAVASRQTKLDGWLAGRGSSCRFASSRDGSALCSLRSCRRRSWPASCTSPAHSRPWPSPPPSP